MKMKTRTIIAIFALGTIGFTNINAIADEKKLINTEATSDKAELLSLESWMTDKAIVYSAEAFSNKDAADEIENFEANQVLPEENILTEKAIVYSARAFSDLEFEKEIEENQTK